MAKLHYTDNSEDMIKKLGRVNGGIQVASSKTVNKGAQLMTTAYKNELDSFTLRNRFTKGGIVTYLSKPKSSNNLRPVKDINAVVGVRKMKGGKDHYLLDQEIGGSTGGNPQTLNKVAMPLNQARTSGSDKKPVRGALRLTKTEVQTLTLGGKPFGIEGDGFSTGQRWAILNDLKTRPGYNLKQQFFFESSKGMGVFVQKSKKKFTKVRDLKKGSVAIKATGKFQKSADRLTQNIMERIFIDKVSKELVRFR